MESGEDAVMGNDELNDLLADYLGGELDEEQRAEIHAILEALRHDGESHTNIVQQLSGVYRND